MPIPRLRDDDRLVVAPWFEQSELDENSPEWAAAWAALVSAELAGERGLILWPTATEDCLASETRAAQTVQAAVGAGALYARHNSDSAGSRTVEMNAGLGVEVILALLHKYPTLVEQMLDAKRDQRVDFLLTAASARVVGVFADARAALTALLAAAYQQTRRTDDSSARPWPHVVNVVLTEAVRDDVFAEHVIVRLSEARVDALDYALLPSGNWLILQGDANGLRPGADQRGR